MKMKNLLSIALLLVSAGLCRTFAQLTPQGAVLQMQKGINIGNTMEPETEGAWGNVAIKEYYFDAYKDAGFQCIRIPIRWDKHTSATSPYAIDTNWLNRVEEVIDWGLSRDLYIIINAHHEEWIKTGYATATLRARFDSIWSQIAVRFKDKSDKLLFEMINEPNGMTQEQIDDLNPSVLAIIRKTNPTRIVIFSGNGYSNSDQLIGAAVPADNYLMGYFHSYDPWSFAGEAKGTWGTASDRAALKSKFDAVKTWSDNNNIPVLLGEFGAIRDCEYNSRMKHYAAYVDECVSHGFAYSAWDDGGDFRIFQRQDTAWNEIERILTDYDSKSPTNLVARVVNDTDISLSWTNKANDFDTLIIERYVQSGAFEPLAYLSPDSTRFIDRDLEIGNYYYYRVVGYYEGDSSRYSYPARAYILPTQREPYTGTAFTVPGEFEAEDFDKGGEMLTYHDADIANTFGDYRATEGVDIEARTDGGYHIGNVVAGEWVEYTINVMIAGVYYINTYVASLNGGGSFSYTFANGSTPAITVPATGSWETTNAVLVVRELEAGEQTLRLNIKSVPAFNINMIRFDNDVAIKTSSLSDILIYPSRISNTLNINFGGVEGSKEVTVCDMQGKTMLSYTTDEAAAQLNTGMLTNGIYLVTIKTSTFTQSSKIIK